MTPLDDVLPLERPVTIAADPAPAAGAEPPKPDQAAKVDIPPPDLPAVEVVIDIPAAPPATAQPAPAEPVAAPPGNASAAAETADTPPAQTAAEQAAPSAATAEIALPPLPPEAPAPVIVADAPADPIVAVATALKELAAAPVPPKTMAAQVGHKDREAILRFYEARDFRPLFVDAAGLTPAGRGVARQVSTAELDGLDPSSYPVPALADAAPAHLADVEWGTALAAFAYARDARGGRLEPTRLSALITPDLELPAAADVLAALAQAPDTAAVLAAYQPKHPGYIALKEKLAELRESTGAIGKAQDGGKPQSSGRPQVVGEGPTLRQGMRDPRVPALRSRLGLAASQDDLFDLEVSSALASWQKEQGLRPTGRLDRGMASALDGRTTATGVGAADIVANMERWRWLPQDLGERHIEVNLPEYTLRVLQDGKVIHQTRVVIGKPQTPTPIFSNKMQYVVVNPYWNIPPSIMKNEILPKLAEDPNYATAHGYEVIRRGNSIAVRQPPGERNALGFIKFLFPNQHSVYLHDTPSRALFAQNKRAFSHGCVRVEQPFRLGQVVLGDEGYDEDRLRRMVGKGERTIRLKDVLPIHLTYFTLFVDENGRLQRREDLYGYDGRVKTALGISPNGLKYANLR